MTKKVGVSIIAGLLLIGSFYGCGGPNDKKVAAQEKVIKDLEQAGVPDTMLTTPRLLLGIVKSTKRTGYSGIGIGKKFDSTQTILKNLQKWYAEEQPKQKQIFEKKISDYKAIKASLKGAHVSAYDSIMVSVDTLVKKNFYFQANAQILSIDSSIQDLPKQQKIADSIGPLSIGVWSIVKDGGKGAQFKVTEKKTLDLKPDGTFELTEELKGQTFETRKEDWNFETWGEYKFFGDMILLNVQREKCNKQIFTDYIQEKGKNIWKETIIPPFDKKYTDHSKDRYFTYSLLHSEYDKKGSAPAPKAAKKGKK